jgi:hypothetical protein
LLRRNFLGQLNVGLQLYYQTRESEAVKSCKESIPRGSGRAREATSKDSINMKCNLGSRAGFDLYCALHIDGQRISLNFT